MTSAVRNAVEPADTRFKNHTIDDGGAALSRKFRFPTDAWYWRRVPISGPIARYSFKADRADGYGFVVANQSPREARYYVEGRVPRDPASGEWSAEITLGPRINDEGLDTGAGKTYKVSIVMIPSSTLEYLSGIRPEADASWWSQTSFPANSTLVKQFEVTRDNNPSTKFRLTSTRSGRR